MEGKLFWIVLSEYKVLKRFITEYESKWFFIRQVSAQTEGIGLKLILILNLINVMLEKWIYQIMEVKQVNKFCVIELKMVSNPTWLDRNGWSGHY